MQKNRWTIYLCQDKHLDYNWCGSNQGIEARMTALLDYYLDQSERFDAKRNLDCTRWLDGYRLHRGKAGSDRLLTAIRNGSFGYGTNHSVQLWG